MLLEFYENIAILLVLMGVIVLFICFALEAIRRKNINNQNIMSKRESLIKLYGLMLESWENIIPVKN